MRADGGAIVARARALVGTRFRAQGRSAVDGVDCVGLVQLALDRPAPCDDYGLRGGSSDRLEAGLRAAGLRPRRSLLTGDVAVMRAGPEQFHLGIWTGEGMIHADARLRRVVERPGAPAWPVLSIWRLEV